MSCCVCLFARTLLLQAIAQLSSALAGLSDSANELMQQHDTALQCNKRLQAELDQVRRDKAAAIAEGRRQERLHNSALCSLEGRSKELDTATELLHQAQVREGWQQRCMMHCGTGMW